MKKTQGKFFGTQRDMNAFAEKLRRWGQDLPPKERELLNIIIERSRGAIPQAGQITTTVATLLDGVLRQMSSGSPGKSSATDSLVQAEEAEGKWKDWPNASDGGT